MIPVPSEVQISASQVETWNDCPRKWAFDKVDNVPRIETPAAALGTKVHAILEKGILRYVYSGSTDGFDWISDERAGPIAGRMSSLAPLAAIRAALPVFGTVSEHEFTMRFPGVRVTGKVDFLAWYPLERVIEIGDFKTTRSIGKYAKDLTADVQAATYAAHAARYLPKVGGGSVRLRWVYGQTEGSKTDTLLHSPDPEQSHKVFLRVLRAAGEIALARRTFRTAREYPARFEACGKFGGCSYRTICGHTCVDPEDRLPMSFPASMLDNTGRVVRTFTNVPLPEHVIQSQMILNPHTGSPVPINTVSGEAWAWTVLDQLASSATPAAPAQLAGPPAGYAPPAQQPAQQPPPAYTPAAAATVSAQQPTLAADLGRRGITAAIAGLDAYAHTIQTPDGRPWAAVPDAEISAILTYLRGEIAAGRSPYAPGATAAVGSSVTPPEGGLPPATPSGKGTAPKAKGGRPKKVDLAGKFTLYVGISTDSPDTSDRHLDEIVDTIRAEEHVRVGVEREITDDRLRALLRTELAKIEANTRVFADPRTGEFLAFGGMVRALASEVLQ